MRVKVIQDWQAKLADMASQVGRRTPTLLVSSGGEYVVYGLSWCESSSAYEAGLYCEVIDDDGSLVSAPIQIFDVIESDLPTSWRATRRDGSLLLWPELFLQPYFFDDLSEGIPEVVAQFASLKASFESPSSGQ